MRPGASAAPAEAPSNDHERREGIAVNLKGLKWLCSFFMLIWSGMRSEGTAQV
ncbi:MAG: hypothetical protein ACI89J_003491 [Hyphomicrobiaceae bacterium]|jgi:hypothetical protein